MEEKVNSFLKIFTHFKESPLQFVTLTVMLFGMYIFYTEIDYIKTFIPNPETERVLFERALETNTLINASLDNTLEDTNSQAVAIAQFHNGKHDLTRLPFTNVSVTYFRGDIGLGESITLQARPLSSMNNLMREMWNSSDSPKCVGARTAFITDDLYRSRLEEAGTEYVSLCPLRNILDYPIGYHAIALDYVPSDEEQNLILAIQRPQAQRIAGYLQQLRNDD